MEQTLPLIWSPEIFASCQQKELYEDILNHNLHLGISLPIHGAGGKFGIFNLVSASAATKYFRQDTEHSLPALICLRDYIVESTHRFTPADSTINKPITLTPRELECLKWCAAGKSSWEISRILCCSEATLNFHFSNIRSKFNTCSRRQAVVKAIVMGLLQPV